MTLYEEQFKPGKLWIRTPNGKKYPAHMALSAIYSKYADLSSSFFFDVNSNNIDRFDVIYDTLFVETSSGCIFEKFYEEDLQIKPYSQANLFYAHYSSKIDYWYLENQNKIYYIDVLDSSKGDQASTSFEFLLAVHEFDCSYGSMRSKALYKIQLGLNLESEWSPNDYTIENPKFTYNPDTQIYNVSFILKNFNNKMGLISINLKENKRFDITEFNSYLPFLNINEELTFIIDEIPSSVDVFLVSIQNDDVIISFDDKLIQLL